MYFRVPMPFKPKPKLKQNSRVTGRKWDNLEKLRETGRNFLGNMVTERNWENH